MYKINLLRPELDFIKEAVTAKLDAMVKHPQPSDHLTYVDGCVLLVQLEYLRNSNSEGK